MTSGLPSSEWSWSALWSLLAHKNTLVNYRFFDQPFNNTYFLSGKCIWLLACVSVRLSISQALVPVPALQIILVIIYDGVGVGGILRSVFVV